MQFIIPVVSAILQAASFTLDKITLAFRQVDYKAFVGVSFPVFFIIDLIIYCIIRPPFTITHLWGLPGIILAASTIIIIFTNLIFYAALDSDHLGEIQTLELFGYFPIIIFMGLFFADERNAYVIIPAVFALLALLWSHWEEDVVAIKKVSSFYLVWICTVIPVSAALTKILLGYWNPISLELVRSGIIAVTTTPFLYRSAVKVPGKAFALMLVTNTLAAVAWILFYFSYQISGVIYTLLIFLLQPLLVYLAALLLLKEPVKKKKVFAFSVVLLAIITAELLNK